MPNNTTARVIRPVLRAAEVEDRVEQVTTGRNYTYVRLVWADTEEERVRNCASVIAALRPLWSDGGDRVKSVYSGMVSIKRAGWYRTEPADNGEVSA